MIARCTGAMLASVPRRLAPMLFAGALLASPAPLAAATPPPIPVEALAELPFVTDPVLSPDGKKIAAKINVNGVVHLAIFDLTLGPDGAAKLVPFDDVGTVRWYSWAGNGRLLIGHMKTGFVLPFAFVPLTRVARYDLASSQVAAVGTARGMLGDDVIFTDPDGRFILLSQQDKITETPSVDRVDLATNASVEVQKKQSGIWSWFADASGTVRGGVSYSDKSWRLFHRGADGRLVAAGGGRFAKDGAVIEAVRLLPGSDRAMVTTNGPTGRFALYEYKLGAPGLGAAIWEHPGVDLSDVRVSPDGSQVEGLIFEDDRLRAHWFAPALDVVQRKLDKSFPGKDNRIAGRSRDGNSVLVWSGGADDPGTWYVFDQRARRLNAFAVPYEKLENARFSPVKPVSYTARDGLSIPGYLTLPAGRDPKGLPLIVMPHGGPFLRTGWTFDPWVQFLASRGYAVLQPNFRGSTGYGREFVERASGEFGLAMQDDLDDGVDWLAKAGTVDPARVCLMGASYGGYAALWGATRNPERYRCAISFAGVTDVKAMVKYDARLTVPSRYFKAWRARITGGSKADLGAVSPLQQAGRLRVPVLIAHGTADGVVPVDQGTKLSAALRARDASVQSVFYPGEGHGFDSTTHSVDFLRRAEAFLEVHNPAVPVRGPAEASEVAGAVANGDYPTAERKARVEGEAELDLLVAADGRVAACTVARSSGHQGLDTQSCKIATERFQYRPARGPDGKPREARLRRAVAWKLPPQAPTDGKAR